MTFYITLFQLALIALKLLDVISASWWIVLLPFIVLNLITFIYSFSKGFKREYSKAGVR